MDINSETSMITGEVGLEEPIETHTIWVTATDRAGLSVDDSFNLAIIEYNEFAETEEDYLDQFSVEGGGNGVWTVEFVANVNGGTTLIGDTDSELRLYYEIFSQGIGNITVDSIN